MSRDGFTRADIDTGLLADPKVVALARRLREPQSIAAHVTLYTSLILGSWAAGERLTLDEAAPAWWLEIPGEMPTNLEAVGLVDGQYRIPIHAWASWYEPARERRDQKVAAGRLGGLASRGGAAPEQPSSAGPRLLNPTDQPADQPTVPAGPGRQARPTSPSVVAPAGANGRSAGPSPAGDPGVDRV